MHPNKKTAGVTDGPFAEIDALAGARTFEFVTPLRRRLCVMVNLLKPSAWRQRSLQSH
jgi:hypothetical protein